MRIIDVYENESITLDDEDILELRTIKTHSPQLPFSLSENKISLDDYIIGEIQLSDKLIRINPRHKTLSLEHYFEMLLYIDNLNHPDLKSISHSENSHFGVNGLIENFINQCNNLIAFGITGQYLPQKVKSHKPKGKIVHSEFVKKLVPIEGVTTIVDEYKIDNSANQIIKAALRKINEYDRLNSELRFQTIRILSHFDAISDYIKELKEISEDIEKFNSSNPNYPICLEYAKKILLDFKLGYSNDGSIQWNAFLENSNATFEKYIRKVLDKDLDHSVSKWEKPRIFAEMKLEKQIGQKAYSPDIIIDYFEGSARAVFDVKNKFFSPKGTTLSDLTSVADIYQLVFYANQLKTSICGLIYPADDFYEPIILDLSGIDLHFFLVTINMNCDFNTRNIALVNSINYCLKYT
jgi:5-methylcytosine-specific restriction endonuclease McrBC regulatory subunit McrC